MKQSRREFLIGSAVALGSAAQSLGSEFTPPTPRSSSTGRPARGADATAEQVHTALYNTDLRTAIGLGDEPPTIVDKYGQILRSRQAAMRLAFGSPLLPAAEAQWSQSLTQGCLPIVETSLRNGNAHLRWSAVSSAYDGLKADYVEVITANVPYQVTLLFPFTTSLRIEGRTVVDGENLLAVFPAAKTAAVTHAAYNFLTPEATAVVHDKPILLTSAADSAFTGSRGAILDRWIEYRFPVSKNELFHVFLGVLPERARQPGERLFKLSVNEQDQWVDYALLPGGEPQLLEFKVIPTGNELRVKSACDPSATAATRDCFLSGIWIFTRSVEPFQVMTGALNHEALFYVRCGQEPLEKIASSVTLQYEGNTASGQNCFCLPYDLRVADADALLSNVSPQSARAAEQTRWESLLQSSAELITGLPHLDNLYRTSLINLFLLRTRFAGQGEGGQDIFVVKPGANEYDTFWTRDGSYIAAALDLAGLPEEAEKSLRLFWQSGLTGTLATWGQQATGGWAHPITEWDGQGQALWTLVNHYEFTRDLDWLRSVYSSILKGALWIKHATDQTKSVNENGEKPICYGLLPVGYGEAITTGYNYYHCFWSVLGLRQALIAAEAVSPGDVPLMKELYADFSANLLASVKLAHQRTAHGKFIPATPFDARAPIWGSLAALYPTRFLDPRDPMITGTLQTMRAQSKEDIYATDPADPNGLWTYITVEAAMCHLLREELPMFHRLYNGYVSHASPTNAWVEWINLPDRTGSGDMPHGWAAAQYVTMHRNALLYENDRQLELCWGVQPEWLHDGAELSVSRAASKFGKIEFRLRRSGAKLVFEYALASEGHEHPAKIRLHVPQLKEPVVAVLINGRSRPLQPHESTVEI